MAVLRPENEEEVVRVLLERYERGSPVAVVGSGGKSGWGETVAAEDSLDLSGLSGVTLYEPNELVLSARAGTPLSMIETLLAENDQELAFEPMDAAPLFGGASGQATLGGTLAANVSGPRRIKAGAARDHVLGIRAVSGWGELFKSGGRVVKNVTGYDLSRGLSGSWGTLAVFTEITLKVLPKAPDSATLVVLGLNDAAGVDLLCAAMGSPWEVSSAAHVPAALSANLPVDLGAGGRALTLMRLEGVGPSVDYRAEKLRALAGDLEAVLVADTESRALWRHLRDASFFAGGQGALWRLSLPPLGGPRVVNNLKAAGSFRHFYDWSGGLLWLASEPGSEEALAALMRGTVEREGGYATLVRRGTTSADVPAFHPQAPALAALARNLRQNFDPKNILNPGRMG